MFLLGGSMVIPVAGGKLSAATPTPTVPAVAGQLAAPLQALGSCSLGFHGYPCISRNQQQHPVVLPPWATASTWAGSEVCKNSVGGVATAARRSTLSAPVRDPIRAVSVPTEPQEIVGAARLKTRGILEVAAELAVLKATLAKRDARMQQVEVELQRKDAAVKARDEQIAVLTRCCEELHSRARCGCDCPFETESVQPCLEAVKLADDGPDQLGAEMEAQTPRTFRGPAREDAGVWHCKVDRETVGDEKCLPGYSHFVSPSLSPRSSLASSRRSEDSRQSSSACRAGNSQRACSLP